MIITMYGINIMIGTLIKNKYSMYAWMMATCTYFRSQYPYLGLVAILDFATLNLLNVPEYILLNVYILKTQHWIIYVVLIS